MKDYLICVDSDGCAMDTMTVKHERCFGPDIWKVWHLKQWQDVLQKRWEEINLYTKDRGINRFSGLGKMLTEIDNTYTPIEGLDAYSAWALKTPAYSEAALEQAIREAPADTDTTCMKKALEWSRMVNRDINALPNEAKVAFDGVKGALAAAKARCDIAIVSSANREAMEAEWKRCGIFEFVDYSLAQDVGTKQACIEKMIASGYTPAHILMIGDAPGDERAADGAGVRYYPILAGHEVESWEHFSDVVLREFTEDRYTTVREKEEIAKFDENLK